MDTGGIAHFKVSRRHQHKNLHNVALRILLKYNHTEKSYTRGKRCSCNK